MDASQSHEQQSHEDNQHDRAQSGNDEAQPKYPTGGPPAPPNPEDDSGIVPPAKSPDEQEEDLSPEHINVFTLKPVSALKLLCHNVDLLVRMTGDIPPTPPVRTPTKPRADVRTAFPHERVQPVSTLKRDGVNLNLHISGQEHSFARESIDGVPFKRTPIGSPESNPGEAESPFHQDVGHNAQPVYIQHATLARKFYSKRPPPISTEDYLLRMHKYCPMSTAVYLAASIYITRLAVTEKVVPVTPRNVHRLLLAGLRVAMKALEDLSWQHGRFAKVGGVTEAELGRLEITFCFLTGFVLKVDEKELQSEAQNLARVFRDNDSAILDSPTDDRSKPMELKLPETRLKQSASSTGTRTPEKRKASSALPSRPALHVGAGVGGGIEVV